MAYFSQSEYYETPGISPMGASVGRNVFGHLYAGGNSDTEITNACRICLQHARADTIAIKNCFIPSDDNQAPCNFLNNENNENNEYNFTKGMHLALGP